MNQTEPLRVPLALVFAAASALLLFAAGEPLGWGPVAWVALVPLFVAVLRTARSRWAFVFGLVFGLVYFGVELWWIFLFGWMAWVALTIVMALYMAIGSLVASWMRRSVFAPMLVAGAFVGAELLRDRWPYGGYSWGSVGTTQGSVPGIRWLAGTVGAYGLSFLCAFVAALIAHRFATGRVVFSNVIVVGVVLSVFVLIDLASYGKPVEGRTMRVAVVQGNVPRPVQPGQRDLIFQSHMDLTMDLLGDPSESSRTLDRVVVWPEDSLGIGVSEGAFEQVVDLAGTYGTPFLVGHSVLDPSTGRERFLNLVDHIDATGRHQASYQKRHPVPFGEYVPISFFRRYVSTLESEIPTDQQPGAEAVLFDIDGTKVATPICFESVFPRDFRDFARRGAELYVLSTNDASFEGSYASEQHLAHTRMRALENRQWVVQAALSGISASIAPDGDISHRTGLFEATAFETEVGIRPPQSLYATTGDLFASIFAALAALVTLWTMLRRKTHPEA